MVISTSYEIQNDKEFAATIDKALRTVSDLRFAFAEIARDWQKSNKTLFRLQGSGLYPPLNPVYARIKENKAGRRLPIMVGAAEGGGESGRLRDSVTKANHPDSIVRITKTALIFGTKTPYGIFHQSDKPRRFLPQRKFLFIGPEAPSSAGSRVTGRLQRFKAIIENEVQSQLDAL